ncbi:MAG TPA: hypothetical protein VH062_02385 [Polyangiaceae bacterium]|nr:hypothetical protein [Polyangiaceae bacterium]
MNAPKLDDFPYDPALRGREMHFDGFEKLRCIEDEKLRELVFAGMVERDRRSKGRELPPPKPRNGWRTQPDRTCVDPQSASEEAERRYR